MDAITRYNILQLTEKAGEIQNTVIKLRSVVQTTHQNSGYELFEKLLTNVLRLEVDTGILLGECIYREKFSSSNGTGANIESLNQVFICLNVFFEDLKKAECELKKGILASPSIKALEINWRRCMQKIANASRVLSEMGLPMSFGRRTAVVL